MWLLFTLIGTLGYAVAVAVAYFLVYTWDGWDGPGSLWRDPWPLSVTRILIAVGAGILCTGLIGALVAKLRSKK
jgi:hypothetical protein